MQKFIFVYTEIFLRIYRCFRPHIERAVSKPWALRLTFSHAIKRRACARFAHASARHQPTLRDAPRM